MTKILFTRKSIPKLCYMKALEFSHGLPGKDILDMGCGRGDFAFILRKEFTDARIVCADIDEKMLQSIPEGYVKKKVDAEKKLPFRNASFDIVFANVMIECLNRPTVFLKELRRILRKNGVLIISTFNVASLRNRVRVLMGKNPNELKERKTLFTFRDFRKILEDSGFNVRKITGSGFPFLYTWPIPAFVKIFFMRLGGVFPTLAGEIVAKCT